MPAAARQTWQRQPLEADRARRAGEWLRDREAASRRGVLRLVVREPATSDLRRRVASVGWERAVRSAPPARSRHYREWSDLAAGKAGHLRARLRPAGTELGRLLAAASATGWRWVLAFAAAVGSLTIVVATLIGRGTLRAAVALRQGARSATARVPAARQRSRAAAAAAANAFSARIGRWGDATRSASVRTSRRLSAHAASAGNATKLASQRAGRSVAAAAVSATEAAERALRDLGRGAWVCVQYPPRLVGRAAMAAGRAASETLRAWRQEIVDATTGVGRAVVSAPARVRDARLGSRALAVTGRFVVVLLYSVLLILMVAGAAILGAYAVTVH